MHQPDEQLIASVHEIGPTIRDLCSSAEKERRLPQDVLKLLANKGHQSMLTPRSLGGQEVDPVTCARVIEEVAKYDSAAGWALQAGNSVAWWCARLPDEGTEEIYADGPSSLIAGAFHPPQRAQVVEGGYRVTGRAPLASNVHDSKWLFLTAVVMQGEEPRRSESGSPEAVGLILKTQEAEIIDTWHSLGMKATDSNDVRLNDVFVPASRAFLLHPEFKPGSHYQGPLYQFPGMGEAAIIIAPVPLAIAQNAVAEFREFASHKTAFGFTKSLRDRSVVQSTLARAEALLRAGRLFFYDTIGRAWERTVKGEKHTLEQSADLLLAGTHAVQTAAEVVDLVHKLAGTSGIYSSNRLERHFRDAQTLRHHGFASAGRYEAVGQVFLGATPEFDMIYF